MTDIYTAKTAVSEYRIEREGTYWRVLDRDGVEYRWAGDIINGTPAIGKRLTVESDFPLPAAPIYHSMPLTTLERVGGDALQAFEQVAGTIRALGRSIGFEGISRDKGMDSVEAMLDDIGRAIRYAQ